MIGHFSEPEYRQRLVQESSTFDLAYLSYLFVPARGKEGVFAEVGHPATVRQTAMVATPSGRAEIQWAQSSAYTAKQANALLDDLESLRQADSHSLAERLHSTICQSLTAAHLHLELGLMSHPKEDYETARRLLHEATTSVRELIDELAGEGEL